MPSPTQELVVISGKGGTGKTSIVAAFASLARSAVLADCDVDAADLHLVLEPEVLMREAFSGGSRARVLEDACTACGRCLEVCRFGAVFPPGAEENGAAYRVDPVRCEGCGVCAWFCEHDAMAFEPAINGEWFVSETRCGPMVHARLGVAEENSGKLVTLVRNQAKALAEGRSIPLVLIDGSPGIGCPVIASITAADLVLVVTEPTRSGMHDLGRVADLTRHFGIRTLVCINKWDLNESITLEIEAMARERNLALAGRVRYDRAVTDAMLRKQTLVEFGGDGAARDVKEVWIAVDEAVSAASGPAGPDGAS